MSYRAVWRSAHQLVLDHCDNLPRILYPRVPLGIEATLSRAFLSLLPL